MDYGRYKEGFVRDGWGLNWPNGIPSEGTIWRRLMFGEDASKVSKDNGPQNLSTVRKSALHLLCKEESKRSMKRKRKKAARDNAFLLKVLKNA